MRTPSMGVCVGVLVRVWGVGVTSSELQLHSYTATTTPLLHLQQLLLLQLLLHQQQLLLQQ